MKFYWIFCLGIILVGCNQKKYQKAVFPFRENNGKFGAINEIGDLMIPAQYDSIGGFFRGRAVFKDGDKFGLMEESGKVVVKPIFDWLDDFEFRAITIGVIDKVTFLIDTSGKVICPDLSLKFGVAFNDIIYSLDRDSILLFFNLSCEKIFSKKAKSFSIYEEDAICFEKNGGVEITNRSGSTLLFIPQIRGCPAYSGGIFYLLGDKDSVHVYNINGRINSFEKKKEVGNYSASYYGSEGLATLMGEDSKKGLYNWKGEIILKPKYLLIGPFKEGLAYVYCENLKVGFINESGELCIPCKFDNLPLFGGFNGSIAKIENDGKFVFINKRGKILFSEPW